MKSGKSTPTVWDRDKTSSYGNKMSIGCSEQVLDSVEITFAFSETESLHASCNLRSESVNVPGHSIYLR